MSASPNPVAEQAKQAYEVLRSLPIDKIRGLSAADFTKAGKKLDLASLAQNPEAAKKGLLAGHKIAASVDEATFVDWVVHGHLPTLKLTPQEMEALAGGFSLTDWLRDLYNVIQQIYNPKPDA